MLALLSILTFISTTAIRTNERGRIRCKTDGQRLHR